MKLITSFTFPKLLGAIILAFLFSSLLPNFADAALVPCGTPGNPCRLCHLFELLGNISGYFFFKILPAVATILIIWGGFTLLTAGENKSKINEAKDIITATVVGFVFIMTAAILLNMFLISMGVTERTGLKNWYDYFEIECPEPEG